MAELVYATDLKSVARSGLRVRVPPEAPKGRKMKFLKYFVCVFITLTAIGCDIEGAIGNASDRCEDEIAKIIQQN